MSVQQLVARLINFVARPVQYLESTAGRGSGAGAERWDSSKWPIVEIWYLSDLRKNTMHWHHSRIVLQRGLETYGHNFDMWPEINTVCQAP